MIDGTRSTDPVEDALLSLLEPFDAPVVVDVGGGSGTRAVPLARAGATVTVVDVSIDALAILQRRAADASVADRIVARQADADLLLEVVPAGSVDLVVCHHVLQTVDDPAAVVAACAAVLRPGGRLSVLVPGRAAAVLGQAAAGRFDAATQILADPDGRSAPTDPVARRFDLDATVALVRAAGLQPERTLGIGVVTGLLGGRSGSLGPEADLLGLEATLGAHPVLQQLGADLLVIAAKPGKDQL
jgi:SAM-dependent methyltransferase